MTLTQEAIEYPFDPVYQLELDPRYADLRKAGGPVRVRLPYGGEGWLAVTHADNRTVLSDPRFSRAATIGRDIPRVMPDIRSTLFDDDPVLIDMDPPEHTRLRGLVAKAFTSRRVADLRPRAEQLADRLVDELTAGAQPGNLVESFAVPLPLLVICEMLGVPPAEQAAFRAWISAAPPVSGMSEAEMRAARGMLEGFMQRLIDSRRAAPGDDLISALIAARDEGDRLSERELVVLALTLFVAGYETAADQIGNIVFALLTHPEHFAALKADRSLLPGAIEELLRFIPLGASSGFPRMATEDVELSGRRIAAGEVVFAQADSANRDETVFDRPDELDFRRTPNPHLGFLHGPHHCLGAQLARMELSVALTVLMDRLPGLRLAVPASEVPFRVGRLTRGVEALPVTW
ncbi:cytochrome P450 [Micromonospora zingiberis]|uniref:Cytochrome P450 n=1 Tax=Micromonospora zingiberis TaxID=2053011 RepID=A0A4R0GJX5_9ACTN|nr:cytochrome P450 [Micromonospora zingiberis]TCB97864.1 cytochrome P450 [Micromonospora zingiberis]